MSDPSGEPSFCTDDAPLSAPLAHGADLVAHLHDYGQLRYAAGGALVTATQVAPGWRRPTVAARGESYAARALDAGPATESGVAWLQYTGGRTGRPKGVMLLQRPAEG